jgi:hypothetical protein
MAQVATADVLSSCVVCIKLLPVVGNKALPGNKLLDDVFQALQRRLPEGWRATVLQGNQVVSPYAGATFNIGREGTTTGTILVQVKNRLEPRDIDALAAVLRPGPAQPVLLGAPFLSPRTRERLRAAGFAYADLTGNVRLSLSEPGLFIETSGASENPQPDERDRKSLKGPKAGRLVRALCDFRPPLGLRELASHAGVDPGYASRVVEFLNREALLTRTERGPLTSVEWPDLLRRWSQEYSPFRRGGATMYLAPRGIPAVLERLKRATIRAVVTGSWAANQIAPVAPARLLLVYVDRLPAAETELDLRPTEAGANVALLTPFDDVVFDRTSDQGGITIAALSQVAADLLTSPGRGPNEAEALVTWMRDHEDAWRV